MERDAGRGYARRGGDSAVKVQKPLLDLLHELVCPHSCCTSLIKCTRTQIRKKTNKCPGLSRSRPPGEGDCAPHLTCGICAIVHLILIKSFKNEFEIEKKMEIMRSNQGRQAPNQLSPMSTQNVARSSLSQPQSRNVQWQTDKDAHLLA